MKRCAAMPRTATWVTAMATVVVLASCTTDRAGDLGFVDRIRNDHPGLSVRDVSDAELVELARATCRPQGLDEAQRTRLASLGIEPEGFAVEAGGRCPTR